MTVKIFIVLVNKPNIVNHQGSYFLLSPYDQQRLVSH